MGTGRHLALSCLDPHTLRGFTMTIQSVRLRDRFTVPSLAYADTMALCVQAFIHQHGSPMRLPIAKHIVARMYGYRNWKQLTENIVADMVPGPLSRQLSAVQNRARIAHCLYLMFAAGVPISVGERLLDVVAPMDTDNPVRPLFWEQDKRGAWKTCSEPDFVFAVEEIGSLGEGSLARYRAVCMSAGVPGGDQAIEGEGVHSVMAKVNAAWKARIMQHESTSLAA